MIYTCGNCTTCTTGTGGSRTGATYSITGADAINLFASAEATYSITGGAGAACATVAGAGCSTIGDKDVTLIVRHVEEVHCLNSSIETKRCAE